MYFVMAIARAEFTLEYVVVYGNRERETLTNIFFASDHHLGHANILKFNKADGTLMRPEFKSLDHMHEVMIERHNRKVQPTDVMYFLGDVGFNKSTLEKLLPRFNGRKRLILGNHDYNTRPMMRFYLEHFQKIMSWKHFTQRGDYGIVVTHFPLHESSFLGRYKGNCINVHGHIHARHIPDPRWVNVSVEEIDYTPVDLEYLIRLARDLKSCER